MWLLNWRDVCTKLVFHQKKMKIDYSMNDRKIRAIFCFSSYPLLCRPMSGVFQRPSGGTPGCQVDPPSLSLPSMAQRWPYEGLTSHRWSHQGRCRPAPKNVNCMILQSQRERARCKPYAPVKFMGENRNSVETSICIRETVPIHKFKKGKTLNKHNLKCCDHPLFI